MTEGWFPAQGLKIYSHAAAARGLCARRRVSEARLTGNARQFAKQTRSCSCKPHGGLHCSPSHFRKLKCDFWLAPLQPPQAALRPEMAALPRNDRQTSNNLYACLERLGHRPSTAWQGVLQIFSIETRQSPRRGQVTPSYRAICGVIPLPPSSAPPAPSAARFPSGPVPLRGGW